MKILAEAAHALSAIRKGAVGIANRSFSYAYMPFWDI